MRINGNRADWDVRASAEYEPDRRGDAGLALADHVDRRRGTDQRRRERITAPAARGPPAGEGLQALAEPDTNLRIFNKPEVHGHRRMAVALAIGDGADDARAKAGRVADALTVTVR